MHMIDDLEGLGEVDGFICEVSMGIGDHPKDDPGVLINTAC